jgi:hypothetical protein
MARLRGALARRHPAAARPRLGRLVDASLPLQDTQEHDRPVNTSGLHRRVSARGVSPQACAGQAIRSPGDNGQRPSRRRPARTGTRVPVAGPSTGRHLLAPSRVEPLPAVRSPWRSGGPSTREQTHALATAIRRHPRGPRAIQTREQGTGTGASAPPGVSPGNPPRSGAQRGDIATMVRSSGKPRTTTSTRAPAAGR